MGSSLSRTYTDPALTVCNLVPIVTVFKSYVRLSYVSIRTTPIHVPICLNGHSRSAVFHSVLRVLYLYKFFHSGIL